MKITHRPSGSMCQVCRKGKGMASLGCPLSWQFEKMKQIKTDKDGVIVVKCEEFEREK